MESHKKDNYMDTTANYYSKRFRWMAFMASFSISMVLVGGLILTWWEWRYHPTNSQLWMVPFGLILFFTPLIIWLPVCFSHMFNNPGSSTGEERSLSLGEPPTDDIPHRDSFCHLFSREPRATEAKPSCHLCDLSV